MKVIHIAGGALLTLSLLACAHTPVSPDALSKAEQPARAAEEAGAEKIPQAALYLKLAREEITAAQRMAGEGDDRATVMFARARVDAELALALAQENATTAEASKALEEIGTSQEESK